MSLEVMDSNGNTRNDGDYVKLTKDLKVKRIVAYPKSGTVVKKIKLTDDAQE